MLRDVLSTFIPAFGWLLVGMTLSRKLAALARASIALDRKLHTMLVINSSPRASLRRPDYRPRRRFPFRTLRSASLWVILTVLVSRSPSRCTPDPQPTPAIIDCAHDGFRRARTSCSLAEATMVDMHERLRR